MNKEKNDYVLNTNFNKIILDENKNVNIENKNEQLLSIFKYSHYKPLLSFLLNFNR